MPSSARLRTAVYAALLGVLLLVLGMTVAASQRDARRALEQRFATRTDLAADFLDSYAHDLLVREASPATTELVAPVAAYLAHAMPMTGFEAFLLDDNDMVLSDNDTAAREGVALATHEPDLAAAVARRRQGTYNAGGEQRFFVTREVGRSPWRLVMTVSMARLHAPLGPLSRVPWLVFACFAAAGLVVLNLLRRLHQRTGELERLSTIDPLTGVANRRQVEDVARVIDAGVRRFNSTTAVLLVDLDHFKAVNDLFGHAVGDEVLRVAAARIAGELRPQDLVGRLGGEEFVVVLAATDLDQARATAERLRHVVAAPMSVGDHVIGITVSIGCAVGAVVAPLLRDADHALYRAKQDGRDRVVVDLPASVLVEIGG